MKKIIVVAGTILADVVKVVETYPEKGMLAPISSITQAVGGCVPNTGIDLKKIDPELTVRAAGRVGHDDYGNFIADELKHAGLNISCMIRSTARTSFSDVVSVRETGERTFFHYEGANAEFCEADLLPILEQGCDLLHVGYIMLLPELDAKDKEHGTMLAKLLKQARERGIKTSVDCVSSTNGDFKSTVSPALKYCNYAILNEIESAAVSGIPARDENGELSDKNVLDTMKYFMQCGVSDKVIIHAPEAGYLLDKTGYALKMPSLSLPKGFIKGTVGAGDAFCAGCLYALTSGLSGEETLKFAAAAAASSLSKRDAVSGMGNKVEILALDRCFRRHQGVKLC